ncbi:MAG: hypothetical protein JWL64_1719 [Frankiales bacterium]|nr:hypothetical protein [Frankiales bacterium]
MAGLLLAALLLWAPLAASAASAAPAAPAAPAGTVQGDSVPTPHTTAHELSWDQIFLPLLGGFGLVVLGAGAALLLANRQRGRNP